MTNKLEQNSMEAVSEIAVKKYTPKQPSIDLSFSCPENPRTLNLCFPKKAPTPSPAVSPKETPLLFKTQTNRKFFLLIHSHYNVSFEIQ